MLVIKATAQASITQVLNFPILFYLFTIYLLFKFFLCEQSYLGQDEDLQQAVCGPQAVVCPGLVYKLMLHANLETFSILPSLYRVKSVSIQQWDLLHPLSSSNYKS